MWTRLALRTRISLLVFVTFLGSALLGSFLLREFAAAQLRDENETAARAVSDMTAALNASLRAAREPQQLLREYTATLSGSDAIAFRGVGEPGRSEPSESLPSRLRVPAWFVRFLRPPLISERYPVVIHDKTVGEIVYEPSMDAELYEKWVGFLLITVSAAGLALLTIAITSLTVGRALRPLRELDRGLARLRDGDYSTAIPPAGPPDIIGSLTAANDLAATLRDYDRENRSLLHKIISVQDDERRDLARELHDELGPLLFSIRANAIALTDGSSRDAPDHPSHRLMASVEEIQTANRRILDRLRPNDIDALGLRGSLVALIDRSRREAPHLVIQSEIDPAIETLEPVVGQTIYRVVQEGLTNILRHSGGSHAWIAIARDHRQISVEVRDDGTGMPERVAAGRGLTGMRERSHAIGGTLEIGHRRGGGTELRWTLRTTEF